ncbi:Vms1/Ankzf1 family peptidyl-tRNA hydrolase [Natronolimnohabitans sp. A-GB9]|uniref:Vms1/Ankzf1 family peptidyl-tRNA hydrolase n=1 Tax=Natronolimnohabitans sp. A-GB9 TaxID=3069757 RepID=UPI0027B7E218|nr:Vms1/Ankzf1 family peptidyl-tRNA hydrolase [Natronolimnohabitans sp. A-GB9]MDQ2050103.1 Vms1/Ankzf1 family peptidyl-tRNA hydrolase [Natronolimnohabitans sp. A-GB9]
MLDELLGRASLKERIDELEEENERLQNRYEAESERRAEATTAKQEAEAEVNRLEDRIAQLEGELERLEDEETTLEPRHRDRLRGARLAEVIDRLASFRTAPEGALTAVLEDGDAVETLREESDVDLGTLLGDRAALVDDAAPCVLCVDDAGLVAVALEPPALPDADLEAHTTWGDRFALEREWFLPTGRYALALVRTDLFALGRYDGDERIDYRGFESDVKGSHSKGGFSQARFERIRDDQIDAHLERCADAVADVDADRLFVVGQRGVVDALVAEADLEPAATAAVDATGDPKPALEDAHRSFWTTTLRVL